MAEETIRITCELQPVGDSLTGRARRQDGAAREFSGWLGLLGALQALMVDAGPAGAAGGEPVPAPEPSP